MPTFVKAPETTASSQLAVNFNTEVLFHTSSSSTQAQLSALTMSGMEDYELTWFGLAIGGNTSAITTTPFQLNIDNSNMTRAFGGSGGDGGDFDLALTKSLAQASSSSPSTDQRILALVEVDYSTDNFTSATTLSEHYKELWIGGKGAGDTTDPNFNDYEHSSNTLNFATSTMGTGGHIFNDDVTNVLFIAFWGPGRYVKETAKRLKIRPTSSQTTEFILQACVRTETQDTAYSEICRLRETTTGLPTSDGTTFFYNQGEDTAWVTDALRDSETEMINTVVYPHTSLVQLSYPRPLKFEDKDDDTTFGFIYEGKKIKTQSGSGAISSSDTFINTTADVAHDFITSKRYGMGEMIADLSTSASAVDNEQTNYLRFMLNEAKVRCEQSLNVRDSAGTATAQNRYTFNSVLDQAANKFETLQKILNNMHSQYYFHNGYLKVYNDQPREAVKIVNQSNCRDIKFTGRNHLPEVNTFYVKYNNERKMFKQDTAFAELRDLQNTGMPIVSKEVVMQGITNKFQAERHARYLAESSRTEKEFVEYTAGADHIYTKPGDLINLTHYEDDGQKHSGRILSISGSVATIDGNIELDPTKTYNIFIDNGVNTTDNTFTPFEHTISDDMIFETTATVSSSSTNQLTLGSTTGLQSINQDNGSLTAYNRQVFNLVEVSGTPTKSYQQEKIYRIQSITEVQPFQYQVVAQRYNGEKWNEVDAGFDFGYTVGQNWATSYTET